MVEGELERGSNVLLLMATRRHKWQMYSSAGMKCQENDVTLSADVTQNGKVAQQKLVSSFNNYIFKTKSKTYPNVIVHINYKPYGWLSLYTKMEILLIVYSP